MEDDPARFVFSALPDEAVVALEHCLEDFYLAFQSHYFDPLHRWYHDQRPDHDQIPLPLSLPLDSSF